METREGMEDCSASNKRRQSIICEPLCSACEAETCRFVKCATFTEYWHVSGKKRIQKYVLMLEVVMKYNDIVHQGDLKV